MSSMTGAERDEPIAIESEDDFEEAVASGDVVLVDFYADWCGPCQMMEPTMDAVAAGTDATVLKVDVDRFQALASSFGVRGVPTLLLFVDGEEAERRVGVQSEDALTSLIAQHG